MLVSRRETLDALGADAMDGWLTYGFGTAASDETDDTDIREANVEVASAHATALAGEEEIDRLHAKLFVEERAGAPVRLTIGSGNATDPAREGRNVEIYAILHTLAHMPDPLPEPFATGAATAALDPFLVPYDPGEEVDDSPKDEGEEEGGLGVWGRLIAYGLLDGCCELRFKPTDDGWVCRIECHAVPDLPKSARVTARPVTTALEVATRLDTLGVGESHDFPVAPLADLTPFVEFTITPHGAGGAQETFVTQLPHEGFPVIEHRASVLRRRMPAAEDWLAALAAALGRGRHWSRAPALPVEGIGADGTELDRVALARAIARIPLLEAVVAHLEDREALEAFGRTLEELRAVVEGADDARTSDSADSPDVLRTLHAELASFWEPFEALMRDVSANDAMTEDA